MFNVSFSELGMVLVVAILMLNPSDLREVMMLLRNFSYRIYNWWWNYKRQLPYDIDIITQNTDENQTSISTKYIVDMEGKPHIAYNMKDIRSQLDKSK